jgi:hypothetical protein
VFLSFELDGTPSFTYFYGINSYINKKVLYRGNKHKILF